MIIKSTDLPSGGLLGGLSSYEIKPLTFIELVHQKTSPEVTDIRSYVRDLKLLKKVDENIGSAPLIDADYLIFLMKMVTINESLKFKHRIKCPHCGNEIRIDIESSDVKVKPLEKVVTEIELGGIMRPVKMPTINEFLIFFDRLPPYSDDWGLDMVKLYSLFYNYQIQPPVGLVKEMVDQATHEQITHLMVTEDYMLQAFQNCKKECPDCKGGLSIDPVSSVADIFRLTLRSNQFNPNKIRIKQIRQTQ
jgi:hypothetical protein